MRALLATAAAIGVLAAVAPSAAVAQATPHTRAAQRALRKVLKRDMRGVGGSSGALVVDLSTGRTLFGRAASAARIPASVEKLYTTSTALLRFGADATLATNVLGKGVRDAQGAWQGTLYLKGGGDPTFGSADFDQSAYGTGTTVQALVSNLLEQAGITSIAGKIVGDESYFDSLRGTPYSGYARNFYVEGLLSALAFDRGFTSVQETAFQTRPALFAAKQFAAAIRAAGIQLPAKTPIRSGHAPPQATVLATVQSPPMSTLIGLTNAPSDNFFAEMLLKGVGAAFGGAGTTAAGAAVVRSELAAMFSIHPVLVDGSGLSSQDATSPRDVVTLLRQLAANSVFVDSLAVAGETGTLADVLQGTPAQGRCRGKTGTLSDVGNLAGYCTARDGHTLAFAFLMNGVDPNAAHAAEYQMAVALAKYNG